MIEETKLGASALAAAIEKLRTKKELRAFGPAVRLGYDFAIDDVLALLAGVSAERSEHTK